MKQVATITIEAANRAEIEHIIEEIQGYHTVDDMGVKIVEGDLPVNADLLEACRCSSKMMMDMASELNHMYPGTQIDYDWSERLKVIENMSRTVNNGTMQAIANAE